jgi:hypothetical protein
MATKKKGGSAKHDLVIRAKGTSSRILDISQGGIRMESTSKGQATGKFYKGIHWDTVEATMQPDGTAQLNVKYIHMTDKGETIVGTGTAVQQPANTKGIAKFTGEGLMWTSSPRLTQLNGAKWSCEGDYNMIKETVEVRGKFDTTVTS